MKKILLLMSFIVLSNLNTMAQKERALSTLISFNSSSVLNDDDNMLNSFNSSEFGINYLTFNNGKITFTELNYGVDKGNTNQNVLAINSYLNVRSAMGRYVELNPSDPLQKVRLGLLFGLLMDVIQPSIKNASGIESKGKFGDIFNFGMGFNAPIIIRWNEKIGTQVGYKLDFNLYQFGKTEYLFRHISAAQGFYLGAMFSL